ncbi:MAG: hypothetical protein HC884_02785 [Chloroflexaceae bacterium]|nr:hypothetical protein [Chloroflexaceae bacterium]
MIRNRRPDLRTAGLMFGALLVGVAWAVANYTGTGGERGEDQLRPLVWTIFSTPLALFIGWVVARRAELWLAAFSCFCLYFFTPFVAARIESLVYDEWYAAQSGHHLYFTLVMVLHGIVGLALVGWRGFPPVLPVARSE